MINLITIYLILYTTNYIILEWNNGKKSLLK